MAAHQGYSTDRLLADPVLNDQFLENCRRLGIPGEAKNWNHLLLNVRKRGGLVAIDTSRRTKTTAIIDDLLFASELAWKNLAELKKCSLDDILCDPVIATEFDSFCQRLSPGSTSFDYRWGALTVRKRFSIKLESVPLRKPPILRSVPTRIARADRLSPGPRQFLLSTPDETTHIFTGVVSDCRKARILERDNLSNVLEFLNIPCRNPRDVLVRVGDVISDQKVQRAEVVRACEPRGNHTFPRF
jgi:hypothetical protein